ncbi:MAG: hypothetical protein M0Q91_14240 [Methanoregula sp.]|nr:hypothetical protein [Methanoregula sp.]
MTTTKANSIDRVHLHHEKGVSANTGEADKKSTKRRPIKSLRGAWGYDIDSATFVETVRRSKSIEPF